MRLLLLLALLGQTGEAEYNFKHVIEQGESDGNFFVKAYVSIPYSSLPFKIKDSLYETSYHVILQLLDRKKNLFGDERFGEIKTETEGILRSQAVAAAETLQVTLPEGRYSGNLTVQALQATRRMNKGFEIQLFHRALGSLRLTNSDGNRLLDRPFDNRDTVFVKVSIYEEDIDSLLLSINRPQVSRYREVLIAVSDEAGWEVALENFTTGTHEVWVRAFRKGKAIDERTAWFNVRIPFMFDAERYEELVDKLIYITKQEERERMKSVSPDVRQVTWDTFWIARDLTPQTEYNETLEEYFAKIEYCERNFSRGDRGYLSDRAKAYMKLGPPDDVEDHPFEMNTNPYIVWIYNFGELRLIFEDRFGFGEYVLTYPPGFLSSLRWE